MSDTLLLNADAQPVSLVPLSAIDWQIDKVLETAEKMYSFVNAGTSKK